MPKVFLFFFKGNSELLDKGRSPFQKSGPGNHETVTIGNAPLKITTLKTTALETPVLASIILSIKNNQFNLPSQDE